METLDIIPIAKPIDSEIIIPGSKSITNRALALAALSAKDVRLSGALFSADTEVMLIALKKIGFKIAIDEAGKTIDIHGLSGSIPKHHASIYVGNAGTAARILSAMLCLNDGGSYHLDGNAAMRKRPMAGLLNALEMHAAAAFTYKQQKGFFPFDLNAKGLNGGTIEVDASASSQILSALLIISPYCRNKSLTIQLKGETVSRPFVDMTVNMIRQFGGSVEISNNGHTFTFQCGKPYSYNHHEYQIEPDATAASYFMALPWVVGGQSKLKNCAPIRLQGDIAFTHVMEQMGSQFRKAGNDLVVTKKPYEKHGLTYDFNAISDTFLTLAAISPLMKNRLTINGIAHTRHQETDRVAAMSKELRKLGQLVEEKNASLRIKPNRNQLKQLSKDKPIEIDTYDDHRFAMSFAILGCYDLHGDQRPWLSIRNPSCCAKTFPHFFDLLAKLKGSSGNLKENIVN